MLPAMLRRAATYFLAIALALGVMFQVANAALAAAGQPAMEMAAMDMDGGCDQPASPCHGLTPDCIDSMGCLASSATPAESVVDSAPFQWGAVRYFSLDALPTGVGVKPEHSPPISCA